MINRHVAGTYPSPITEARRWVETIDRPDDLPLIDVAQAVPGYPPAPGLIAHLREVDQVAMSKYGAVLGDPALREATATDMSRSYGSEIDPANVAITAGANQAFCLTTMALCEPGTTVIIPTPFYFNHDMWLRMNNIDAVMLPCDERMIPRIDLAAELIDERTRAIALVSPNNPTGRVYPPDVLEAFGRLALANGIYLIVDETYRDFRPTTEPAHNLFADPSWDASVVSISSFSKVFSITGHRVGWMAASEDVLAEVDKIADCLTICPPRLGQAAALYGLEHLEGWVDANRLAMSRRVETFTTAMADAESPYEVVSAGAYFAYVRHPFEGTPSTTVAQRLLAEQSILALAGQMFGTDQHGYLRLAFANLDDAEIPELVRRLSASVD